MSSTSKSAAASSVGGGGWPAQNVLSIHVPLSFILAGIGSLLTAVVLVFLRPEVLTTYHYNQYIIAITHLVVLGWVCCVVMGAMYQLVPVALETKLYSQKIAVLQFALHLIGFCGMVWMFWKWDMKQVGHFGSVLAVGVVLFCYNLIRTLFRIPRWNVVAAAIASTLFWLVFTVSVGLMVAAGKCSYESTEAVTTATWQSQLIGMVQGLGKFSTRFDQIALMHAHAHAGVVGVFLMLIVGVSYRLVPMFTLSEIQNPRRALVSVVLLNAGLAGAFLTILFRSPLKVLFSAVAIAGVVIYGLELRAILRARKRRVVDAAVKYFLSGVFALAILSPLALALSWPGLPMNNFTGQLETVYAVFGVLGLVSFAIMGMLYKIVPFLVWYYSYSRQIGLARVPALADLYSPKVQFAGFICHLAGLLTTCLAVLLQNQALTRAGVAVLGVGVLLLLANIGGMVRHIFWPSISPLPTTRAAAAKPTSIPMTAAAASH